MKKVHRNGAEKCSIQLGCAQRYVTVLSDKCNGGFPSLAVCHLHFLDSFLEGVKVDRSLFACVCVCVCELSGFAHIKHSFLESFSSLKVHVLNEQEVTS